MTNTTTFITAASAAKKLHCSKCTVPRWAKELRLGQRLGTAYMLTAAEVAKIGAAKRKTVGNPTGWKQANQAAKTRKTRKNTGKTGRKKLSRK